MTTPCPALICVVPPDLNYSTQGIPPPPLPPVSPIECNFKNETVYFNDVCSSGVPTFSGSLPNWLTIDSSNNRLVVAAGTFCGATVIASNEEAQNAVNQFVATNLGNGNLTCKPPIIILPDDEVTSILQDTCQNIQSFNGKLFYCDRFNEWLSGSSDGYNWTKILTLPFGKNVYDVAFGNGIYVGSAFLDSTHTYCYTSPDGVTWTQRTISTWPPFLGKEAFTVAFGSGIFVAGLGQGYIFHSTDGISWSSSGQIDIQNIYRIRFLNGKFYAIVQNSNKVYSSPDALTWTLLGTFNTPFDIGFGNGIFVLAYQDFVATSPDGVTWVSHSLSGLNTGIAFGDGKFCVVNNNKKVLFSTDGVTWSDSGRTANNGFGAVTFFNGFFVAGENP